MWDGGHGTWRTGCAMGDAAWGTWQRGHGTGRMADGRGGVEEDTELGTRPGPGAPGPGRTRRRVDAPWTRPLC